MSLHTKVLSGSTVSPGDITALQALWRQYETKAPLMPPQGKFSPSRPERFRFVQPHAGNHYAMLCEQDSGNVIACVTITLTELSEKAYATLEDLVVDQAHRKQGHGSLLLHDAITWIHNLERYFFIQATVHPGREDSNAFFPNNGFQLVARAEVGIPGAVNLYRKILVT